MYCIVILSVLLKWGNTIIFKQPLVTTRGFACLINCLYKWNVPALWMEMFTGALTNVLFVSFSRFAKMIYWNAISNLTESHRFDISKQLYYLTSLTLRTNVYHCPLLSSDNSLFFQVEKYGMAVSSA